MHLRAVPRARPTPPWRPGAVAGVAPGVVAADRAGRPLPAGSAVLVHGGAHRGRVAEVVGWGGRRGVEVVVHGRRPAFLALSPSLLELVAAVLLDPVVPRRAPGRSAAAGGGRQPADGAAAQADAGGTGTDGAGAGLAAGGDHQHALARPLAGPKGGVQPGPSQPVQPAQQGRRAGGA
jgi:hypothetical protein